MQNVGTLILTTAISVMITLVATFIFNKLVAMPTAIRRQREANQQEMTNMRAELDEQKVIVTGLKATVDNLPNYRAQSLNIQQELRAQDNALLETCRAIQTNMTAMKNDIQGTLTALQQGQSDLQAGLEKNTNSLQEGLNKNSEDLDLLKKSEQDKLRIQLINQYHLFADPTRNPKLAWSEMEYHAFNQLLADYEKLGGNDYVHGTVLPAMNELEIVSMVNVRRLEEVMNARHASC